jgi:hypothetical protein
MVVSIKVAFWAFGLCSTSATWSQVPEGIKQNKTKQNKKKKQQQKKTPWPLVRERTIPTERPPLVDEI